jgi:energy-coupling factor transport system ATP-binding protein
MGDPLQRRRGRLAPVELAEAAVLADLAVGLHLLGFLLPFGGALQAMAVTPFAALAARHRTRAVLVAASCGAMVAFLVAGLHLSLWVVASGLIGLAVGQAYRRHWGWVRSTAVAAALAGSLMAGATVVTLLVLPHLRRLTLAQLRITWRGATRVLEHVGLTAVTGPLTTVVDEALRWWWATLPGFEVVFVAAVAVVTRGFSHPAIHRLELAVGRPQPPLPTDDGEAGPVPATLEHVSHRYPDATTDALCDVSLSIEEGRLTTIVGPNGSGKSTLARLLAGMPPTSGRVLRPGQAALGRPGGTSLIFQRPESQVLGVRVDDDIRWGAGPAPDVDLAGLLAAVGLGGMEERETATLSGGQLQRLAIAAALSRRPALLVSDESTSMLDPPGQQEVLSVLRRLVASGQTTVVHVTHQPAELDGAAVIALEKGRLATVPLAAIPLAARASSSGPGPETAGRPSLHPLPAPAPRPPAEPLVRLREVGYVYAPGTPWARRALSGVSLEIGRGEVVAVVGPNAAGKSTLAWVLGGLLAPTEGEATMGGVPLPARLGHVGITFQHARLQLFRSRVERDVVWGTDLDREGAAAALAEVGLSEELLDRRIDALSGGEQRRVALAGMLARRPSLVVLDEPLAGLDGEGRKALADIVARLRASRTVSVVLVSHDVAFAGELADRTVVMDGGRVVGDSRPTGQGTLGPERPGGARTRGRHHTRRSAELPLLRYVPGDSPVHRLWAGTKLLAVLAFSVAASVRPSWASEGVLAAVLLLWMAVAGIGRGALPRVPAWFGGGLALGAVLALLAGGGTTVTVAGLTLGLSGLNLWAEFTCLVLLLILASLLVGLTTPLAELGPALSRLLAPLRRVRLPVDELVVAVALCARSLTLLGEEIRILGAARRARRPVHRQQPRGLLDVVFDAGDLVVTGLISAVRRAGEMAQAIEARGGLLRRVPGGAGPGRRDAVALAVVVVVAVGMALA